MKGKVGKLVGQWLNKADKDLMSAEKELASENPITETICFHSQQAAEKYLKAYLVKNGKPPPRTHDIGIVLRECATLNKDFELIKKDAVKLTIYGVVIRYPDDFYEPTIEEAKEAVEIAKKVKEFVEKKIK